jgi:hypothetical protein
MPTIDVVSIDELNSVITQTIAKVNDGVAAARLLGIQAELPKQIDFDVNVFTKWQELEIVESDNGQGTETNRSTEAGGTTSTDTTEGRDNKTSNGRSTHVENRTGKREDFR